MLRTAPPETIEQAHIEAFTSLTPDQRARILGELVERRSEKDWVAFAEGRKALVNLQQLATQPKEVSEGEWAAKSKGSDVLKSLARLATLAEMRQPGTMQHAFGSIGMSVDKGDIVEDALFEKFAARFIGSMIAEQFFDSVGDDIGFDESTS